MRILSAVLALAYAIFTPAASADDRYALLIGNENYSLPEWQLHKPHADVETLQVALIETGFDPANIFVLQDGTQGQMNTAIIRFVATLKSAGEDSVGFMYFSGHGASVIDGGLTTNYFIPVDAEPRTDTELTFVGVSVSNILTSLATVNAQAVFFIADSCRNPALASASHTVDAPHTPEPTETVMTREGPVTRSLTSAAGAASRGFAVQRVRGDAFVAYATGEGQVAPDDGLFAQVLAKHIVRRGIRASLAISDALTEIGSQREQRPFLSPGRSGDFCFNSCTLPAPVDADAGAREVWKVVSVIGTVDALQVYIDTYPDGPNVEDARRMLADLGVTEAAPVLAPAAPTPEPTVLADLAETPAEPVRMRSLVRQVREQSFCGSYNVMGSQAWTREFHKPTEKDTWHVFVASLPEGGSISDAMDARDNWRRRFPNLQFALMPTINRSQTGNRRYAIVLAEGLDSGEQASEIVRFARECGVASDAFRMQQPF